MTARSSSPHRVAVVVAGAGARGGYEAGVLSVLVPKLYEAGAAPLMFVGTSAGAINATIFAALSHLPPATQAERALQIWRGITTSDVFGSPIIGFPRLAASFTGELLGLPGVTLTHLLDTHPLRRTAESAVNWDQLRRNINAGRTSLAVVATSGADNRTVVFIDRGDAAAVPPTDDERPIDYVPVDIAPEHVLASSAIPIAFPPVHVASAHGRDGWYIDGGVRLNAPLKPALALGADAVAVVATHPVIDDTPPAPAPGAPPDVYDVVVRLMDAALVDRMTEDLRTLAKINALVDTTSSETATGRPRKVMPFLTITPPQRATLARLADDVFAHPQRRRRDILPALRNAELRLLGRALGGDGPRRGDLFSYLYFDPQFIGASIELGRQHALAVFDGLPAAQIPWHTDLRQHVTSR